MLTAPPWGYFQILQTSNLFPRFAPENEFLGKFMVSWIYRSESSTLEWPDFDVCVVITLCFFFILLTLSSSFDCRRLIARNSEISFSSFEFLSICFLALSWLFSSSLIRLSFCSSCFKTLSSVLVWTLLSFTWIGQAWISRFFWTKKKYFKGSEHSKTCQGTINSSGKPTGLITRYGLV